MPVQQGNTVRFSDTFCESYSTHAGQRDAASRRGQVMNVFDDGELCNVDWGDIFMQFSVDCPSLVVVDEPRPPA